MPWGLILGFIYFSLISLCFIFLEVGRGNRRHMDIPRNIEKVLHVAENDIGGNFHLKGQPQEESARPSYGGRSQSGGSGEQGGKMPVLVA